MRETRAFCGLIPSPPFHIYKPVLTGGARSPTSYPTRDRERGDAAKVSLLKRSHHLLFLFLHRALLPEQQHQQTAAVPSVPHISSSSCSRSGWRRRCGAGREGAAAAAADNGGHQDPDGRWRVAAGSGNRGHAWALAKEGELCAGNSAFFSLKRLP